MVFPGDPDVNDGVITSLNDSITFQSGFYSLGSISIANGTTGNASTAVTVEDGATIDGDLINGSGSTIRASGGSSVGILDRSPSTPRIVNDGTVTSTADDYSAFASGIEQNFEPGQNIGQIGSIPGALVAEVQNNWWVLADAESTFGDSNALADAGGVRQIIDGEAGEYSGQAIVSNGENGRISGEADADADYDADASALGEAYGVDQRLFQVAQGSASVDNDGLIEADAEAEARVYDGEYDRGEADARAVAVNQDVESEYYAALEVSNAGGIMSRASSYGESADGQDVDIFSRAAAAGVSQMASVYYYGEATVSTVNDGGEIIASASARGRAWDYEDDDSDEGGISAWGEAGGVVQYAVGESASAFAVNGESSHGEWWNHGEGSDSLIRAEASVNAVADGEADYAWGEANVVGIGQYVGDRRPRNEPPGKTINAPIPLGDSLASAINRDRIEARGEVTVSGSDDVDMATGEAFVRGIYQEAFGGEATAYAYNRGSVNADAIVDAFGNDGADAAAFGEAVGIGQIAGGYDATLDAFNRGDISANAETYALLSDSGDAITSSRAAGVGQFGMAEWVDASIVNTRGEISATGSARSEILGEGSFGEIDARAATVGAWQQLDGAGVTASLVNGESWGEGWWHGEGSHGDATISAWSHAIADPSFASSANADASATGVAQELSGESYARGEIVNNGSIHGFGEANADSDTAVVRADSEAWGVYQSGESAYDVELALTNTSPDSIDAIANGRASSGNDASADAYAAAVQQRGYSDYDGWGEAQVRVDNVGAIHGEASTRVDTGEGGDASSMAYGVAQDARGYDSAGAFLVNGRPDVFGGHGEGEYGRYLTPTPAEISASSVTNVYADDGFGEYEQEGLGEATAISVSQLVGAAGHGEATAFNFATVSANAFSNVQAGFHEWSDAQSLANATGIEQFVNAGESALAMALNTSDQSIDVDSYAFAEASDAFGESIASGILQSATNAWESRAIAMNSGLVDVSSIVEVDAGADISDSGEAFVSAVGIAQSASSWDDFIRPAYPGDQQQAKILDAAPYGSSAAVFAANSHEIRVFAKGEVQGDDGELAGEAYVVAQGAGIAQSVSRSDLGEAAIANAGSPFGAGEIGMPFFGFGSGPAIIDVDVVADANGNRATATADAFGTVQGFENLSQAQARFLNDEQGQISASSSAIAGEAAYAFARGHGVFAFDGDYILDEYSSSELWLDIANDGLIDSFADAESGEMAVAAAIGIDIQSIAGELNLDVVGVMPKIGMTPLHGELVNSETGAIFARARATTDSGTSSSQAVGIHMASEANETTTVNRGLIFAQASSNGESFGVAATGIMLENGMVDRAPFPLGESFAQIVNDGGRIIAINTHSFGEGEATHERGVAIDTVDAPNAVQIAWEGNDRDGYIAGHVWLSGDDTIDVSNGVTILDGIVNTEEQQDVGAPYPGRRPLPMVGALSIDNGGDLVLAKPGWWSNASWPTPSNDEWDPGIGTETWWPDAAASQAFVDHFHVGENGTLTLQLGNDDSYEAYGHVFANTITLDEGSTLFLAFEPDLYDNTLTFTKIIDAPGFVGNDPNNTFTNIEDNSVLLQTSGDYVIPNDSLTVALARQAFGAVDGLSGNGSNLGDAIEDIYPTLNPGNTDPFTTFVKNLFTLNETEYLNLMMQASGSEYPQALKSVLNSTNEITDIISDRMECSASMIQDGGPGNADRCFVPGEGRVWIRGFASTADDNGDGNAPGYGENRRGVLIGGDYAFNERWYAGAAGGYFSSDMNFDPFGGPTGSSIDYQGGQVALYGGYDTGSWYTRGVLAGGFYNGSSTRIVTPPGAAATLNGDFNASTVSFNAELGKRMDVAGGTLTPFVGLTVGTGNLGSFTESETGGPSGMALSVTGSSASKVASLIGARFSTEFNVGNGVLVPQVSVAWEHNFADPANVDMALVSAPPGTGFTAAASDNAKDLLLLDVGGSFVINKSWEAGVSYKGRIGSGFAEHGVSGKLGKKF